MYTSRFINNLSGWIIFTIAFAVYLLTLEPSVSFWDCGEFIASSYKLQIGHPPGAPLYQMVGRVFTLLAPGTGSVAWLMNAFSALASAATIMFLFWTITHLLKRSGTFKSEPRKQTLTIAAGAIGALSFAFTDSFWFSAVESEVYAFSSLFTAVVFWAILKWEEQADYPQANRWLVLIAYLIGLSIGVHLLNLLAIPAIAMVWYFKKYKVSFRGVFASLAISAFIVAFIMYGIVQGSPLIAQKFEVFMVNSLEMPFNSGIIFFLLVLTGICTLLLVYTHKKKKPVLNIAILSIALIYIGFSSYSMIIIRSAANPPMNENAPENAYMLMKYLNRTQYGSTPLLWGNYYNAPAVEIKEGKTSYYVEDGKYVRTTGMQQYEYENSFKTIFPRMYSNQPSHIHGYQSWANIAEKALNTDNHSVHIPTFTENLRFLFNYQLNHMYVRYFMWNFSGRQNDKQGHGGIFNGNWLSGIAFLDTMRLGHNGVQPESLSNPATTNRYFMLPFLLGLLGLFFHYRTNNKDFWVVMLLFFMTGIAIILYLNQTPFQPRERDYAYVGSFYAFSIWIGIGVASVYKALKNKIGRKAIIPAIVLSSIVPLILIAENYNDHDRSGRYFVREVGKNYLKSCESNAILLTYGDNDTFPLWYLQDAENFRTDVRVCNVTLLNSDWYIDQMKEKKYESEPLPISMSREMYKNNTRNTIIVRDDIQRPVELTKLLELVLSNDVRTKLQSNQGELFDYLPTRQIKITVDKEQVLKSGTVPYHLEHLIEDSIIVHINSNYITKSELILLDMLANNNWKRPFYFDLSVKQTSNLKLDRYLQHEGLAYRLVPIKNAENKAQINSNILFERLMNEFEWGNIGKQHVHIDHLHARTIEMLSIKEMYCDLAETLIDEKSVKKSMQVIDKFYDEFPAKRFKVSPVDIKLANAYYKLSAHDKGDMLITEIAAQSIRNVNFYLSMGSQYINHYQQHVNHEMALIQDAMKLADDEGRTEANAKIQEMLDDILSKL